MKRSERNAVRKIIKVHDSGTVGIANNGRKQNLYTITAPWGETSFHGFCSDVRPITRAFPGPQDQDMTGKRFGGLRVIGYSMPRHAAHSQWQRGKCKGQTIGATWVTQCDCGKFEIRSTKSLKRESGKRKTCRICAAIEKLVWMRDNLPNASHT